MVLLLICAISAGILFYDMVLLPKQNQELTKQLKEDFPKDTPPGDTSPKEELPSGKESQLPAVSLSDIQVVYPEVQGWLTIPETGIDYPVLQSSESDPEYYLRHNYRKEYDVNGSLFLQWDCKVSESDNYVIYGHNMNSGAMFGNLDRFTSSSYWAAHQSVFFQTAEGIREYQIAAVLKTDVSVFPFTRTEFVREQEILGHIGQAKRLSLFRTGVDGGEKPHVLTLVTCSYEWDSARLVVVAVEKSR